MFRMTPVESAKEAKAFYDAQRDPAGRMIPVMRSDLAVAKQRRHETASREMLAARAKALFPPMVGD